MAGGTEHAIESNEAGGGMAVARFVMPQAYPGTNPRVQRFGLERRVGGAGAGPPNVAGPSQAS
jgi:hypothetical protein